MEVLKQNQTETHQLQVCYLRFKTQEKICMAGQSNGPIGELEDRPSEKNTVGEENVTQGIKKVYGKDGTTRKEQLFELLGFKRDVNMPKGKKKYSNSDRKLSKLDKGASV